MHALQQNKSYHSPPPLSTGSINPGLPGRVQETRDDTSIRHLGLLLWALFDAVAELATAHYGLQTVHTIPRTAVVSNAWNVGINVTGNTRSRRANRTHQR